MTGKARLARVLLMTARGLLVLITLLWGGFAILSGVRGDAGISWWQNLPNAAPWVVLAGVVWVAFVWPRIGGGLAILFAMASVIFFNAWNAPVVLVGVSLPLLAAGVMLVLGGFLAAQNA